MHFTCTRCSVVSSVSTEYSWWGAIMPKLVSVSCWLQIFRWKTLFCYQHFQPFNVLNNHYSGGGMCELPQHFHFVLHLRLLHRCSSLTITHFPVIHGNTTKTANYISLFRPRRCSFDCNPLLAFICAIKNQNDRHGKRSRQPHRFESIIHANISSKLAFPGRSKNPDGKQ